MQDYPPLADLAITGHRPRGLVPRGVHPDPAVLDQRLLDLALALLSASGCRSVVSGMALGVDQAFARAALMLRKQLVCAIPFKGQESTWTERQQVEYRGLLARATDVFYVGEAGYALHKFQKRNEWMVDHAEALLAIWQPGSTGGTANCIAYANRRGVPVTNHWARWTRHSGFFQ